MLKKGKQKVPVYGLPCLPVDCNGLDCTRVALFVLLYTSCVNKAVINHGEGPLLHIGSARKAGKAIVRRRRSTFRSRLLGFRLAGCFRPCLAPRANGASGQAEDILVPVWGFPALRPVPVPRLARCVRFLSSSPSLPTLAAIADVRTFDLVLLPGR